MSSDWADGRWHGWMGGEQPVHNDSVVDATYADGMLRKAHRAALIMWDEPLLFRVVTPHATDATPLATLPEARYRPLKQTSKETPMSTPNTLPGFNPSGSDIVAEIKRRTDELLQYIDTNVPDNRSRDTAVTNYQQAAMWAVRANFD